jgi:hypothetical protein
MLFYKETVNVKGKLGLTIRYMRKYVQPELWQHLDANKLAQHDALFGYVDQNKKSSRPAIIPCRFAKIERSECEGRFVVIDLSVRGYPKLSDQESVDQEIESSFPSSPEWDEHGTKLGGQFALFSNKRNCSFDETSDIEHWQGIVDRLGECLDYKDQPFFPRVIGVYEHATSGKRQVEPARGVYPVKSGSSYELKIAHYHPYKTLDTKQPTGWLLVESDGALSINRNRAIEADSPYSLNYTRFRTDFVRSEETAALSVFLASSSGSRPSFEDGVHLYDLPLRISPRHLTNILLALVIGILLGAPYAVRWMPASLDLIWQLAIIFVPPVIAAGLAIYAIRKPI